MNELKDYITVAQYAEYLGKTTAHVYQQINAGLVPVVTFQRGKMNGRLIEKPVDYDDWFNKQQKNKSKKQDG